MEKRFTEARPLKDKPSYIHEQCRMRAVRHMVDWDQLTFFFPKVDKAKEEKHKS